MQTPTTTGSRTLANLAPPMAYRLSTGLILLAAFASFLLSVTLWFSGHEQQGIFVGIWVPSILSFGALIRPERRMR